MYRAHIARDPHTSEQRVQTCSDHARSVAVLAKRYLSPMGLAATGELAGLVHDMGKFTEEFDDYLDRVTRGEKAARGSVIHTFAGVRYMLERFHTHGEDLSFSDLAAEIIGVAIGSHHGLIDLWDEHHQNGFDHRLNHQPAYDKRAADHFHAECDSADTLQRLYQQAEAEICQFYMQRIGQCAQAMSEVHFALSMLSRLVTSAVVDADRMDTRYFMEGLPLPQETCPPWADCAAQIEAHLRAFPKDTPMQQARGMFSDSCAEAAKLPTGLYRLDLPTGGGKTLAALRFAVEHARQHQLQRVFYIAPLLTIIEQNAEVIRRAIGDSVPLLEHHSNIVREKMSADEFSETELLQETWDVLMIVTTFVQLLETLFSGKMASVRRFHSLCRSVIIIDEVQSLPPKMLSLFNCAVNFLTRCCGTTIVLCSATQPAFGSCTVQHRMLPSTRLISEELFNRLSPIFRRTEIVDAGLCDQAELAERALAALKDSDSLLIVCNTKREASELFDHLADRTDARLFHLSAGMCMAHRKQVLADMTEALQAGERLICVSTQVIEAGIDASFGAVFRLCAGLDNVVQAAGRCNRHGEHDAPQQVCIFRLKDERLGPLREIREAQKALEALLAEYRCSPERYGHDLTSDAAVQDYYAFLYRAMPLGYQDDPVQDHTLYELLSTNHQFAPDQPPKYHLQQAFRTAGDWFKVFDSDSVSVLVPYQEGAAVIHALEDDDLRHDMGRVRTLLTRAKPYTVSVSANQLDRMMQKNMLYSLLEGSIYVLNDGHYDNQTGIKEVNDPCSTLIL